MRKLAFGVIGVALVVVVVIGLSQSKGDNGKPQSAAPSAAQRERDLAGSPPALAGLHEQSNKLIEATPKELKARLAELRGHPVVLNGWASWCGPCRFEFPFLQSLSARYGKEVAFIGLDAGDNTGDAAGFLKKFPVSYPSYVDPSYKIAFSLNAPKGLPFTIFFGPDGEQEYVHQGGYPTQEKLEEDIRRYALGADADA